MINFTSHHLKLDRTVPEKALNFPIWIPHNGGNILQSVSWWGLSDITMVIDTQYHYVRNHDPQPKGASQDYKSTHIALDCLPGRGLEIILFFVGRWHWYKPERYSMYAEKPLCGGTKRETKQQAKVANCIPDSTNTPYWCLEPLLMLNDFSKFIMPIWWAYHINEMLIWHKNIANIRWC